MAQAAAAAGAAGIIATNTTVDHAGEQGGLSGEPLKLRAEQVCKLWIRARVGDEHLARAVLVDHRCRRAQRLRHAVETGALAVRVALDDDADLKLAVRIVGHRTHTAVTSET